MPDRYKLDAVLAYVEAHPDCTAADAAEVYGAPVLMLSKTAAQYARVALGRLWASGKVARFTPAYGSEYRWRAL